MVEALRTDFSVRQICETLGFNQSNLYYHLKQNPCEAGLRDEIEKLSLLYPTYGYKRITQLLVGSRYTIGYKRVARLMKSANLLVAVKRVCQTTTSVEGVRPCGNRLENLDVSQCDQVWVGDITYVRLKGHFIYVCLLMDVFTRRIRGWPISQHLTQSLTLKPLETTLCQSVPKIHHSDQGVQYLSNAYISRLRHHGIEIQSSGEGVLGKTDMLKDLSARSRKKKFISTTMRTSRKRGFPALGILLHRCIIANALTLR